jgi:phage shock protein E
MNWMPLLVIAIVLAIYLLVKRSGQVSAKEAHALLKKGALVIDVRTAGEFVAGHLPFAVNLPLNEIETAITRRVREKNQVLLLHCQSGMRSGAAMKKLKAMGYPHVYNLGSYARAAGIVRGK